MAFKNNKQVKTNSKKPAAKQKEFDNDMRGVLFENHDRKSEASPDYKGSMEIGGVKYWLASWEKESKAGETFLSIAITEAE